MSRVSLEFAKLPLVEVTARWSLAQPLPLSVSFLHDLIGALPAGYTEINDIDQITAPPGIPTFEVSTPPSTYGVTADNIKDGTSLRVERQLLAITWRSKEDDDGELRAYPRFHQTLQPALKALRNSIVDLIGEECVIPSVANMFYSNLIETDNEATFEDICTFLKDMSFGPIGNSDKLHDVNLSWRNGNLVDLRIQCRASYVSNQIENAYGFSLLTSGGTAFSDPTLYSEKLDLVHDAISDVFDSLITDEANRRWARAGN